jgi:hypothetical protein
MNSYHALYGEAYLNRPARRTRDPLQIPVELNDSGTEHLIARIAAVTRDIVLWLAIVFGAAIAVLFAGAAVPELNAAAPHPARETPAIVRPAPSAGEVREWYLPDVVFNDRAAVAEPIETF